LSFIRFDIAREYTRIPGFLIMYYQLEVADDGALAVAVRAFY
jgi:hypothetical protein